MTAREVMKRLVCVLLGHALDFKCDWALGAASVTLTTETYCKRCPYQKTEVETLWAKMPS